MKAVIKNIAFPVYFSLFFLTVDFSIIYLLDLSLDHSTLQSTTLEQVVTLATIFFLVGASWRLVEIMGRKIKENRRAALVDHIQRQRQDL